MDAVNELYDAVVEKEELRSIDESFARDIITNVIESHRGTVDAWEEKGFDDRASEAKTLVKHCRRRLRNVYGMFFHKPYDLEEKKQVLSSEEIDIKDVMKRHVSTRERLPHYPYLFDHIDSFYGDIASVLDLGCGYNPLWFSVLDDPPRLAIVDVSGEELEFVSSILEDKRISVTPKIIDLSNREELEILNEFDDIDVSLCFKLFDTLETKTTSISKIIIKLLARLMNKGIIVSFSKRTLSGRNIIDADREWFEESLEAVAYDDIKTVETINEVFYLVRWKRS